MEQNTTLVTYRPTRRRLSYHDPLLWLELSFTTSSFEVLKRHRTKLSLEAGQPVSLGRALDALIKSHPLATGEQG